MQKKLDNNYAKFEKLNEQLLNLISETLILSEDTKVIKEENIKFSSKLNEKDKYIFPYHSFDKCLDKMSIKNRVGINIAAAKSENGATIKMKLDNIKSDHVKYLTPLTRKYQPSHQTKLPNPMNKNLLVSQNIHSLNHSTNLHMYHSSPKQFFHEPLKWNSTSTSKIVEFHSFNLLPIPINKQDMAVI